MHPFSSIFGVCVLTSLLGTAACSSAVQQGPSSAEAAHAEPTIAEKRAAAVELVRLGKEQLRTGDSLRAQEYFATAIDSGADADVVLPDLMRAAISGMRYQAAIRYFEDFGSLMSRAHRAELGVVVGVLYLGVEQPERARTAFETALKLQPNNARAHFLLAQILREELADYAGSDAHFRAYLTLDPNGEDAPAARAGLLVSPEETLAAASQSSLDAHTLPQRVER